MRATTAQIARGMKLDVAALDKRVTVARAAPKAAPVKAARAKADVEPPSFGFPAPAPRRHATTVSVVTPKARRKAKVPTSKPTARKPSTRGKTTGSRDS